MTIYQESGLNVNLSDLPHFRFQNLNTYKALSGKNIKEMDFVFLHNGTLVFLEIKSFQPFLEFPQKDSFQKKLKDLKIELPKTLTDALLMMTAVWLKTPKGQAMQLEGIPKSMINWQSFTLLLAIDLPVPLNTYIGELNTAVTSALNGYMGLYNSKVLVVDYNNLLIYFPFIQRVI